MMPCMMHAHPILSGYMYMYPVSRVITLCNCNIATSRSITVSPCLRPSVARLSKKGNSSCNSATENVNRQKHTTNSSTMGKKKSKARVESLKTRRSMGGGQTQAVDLVTGKAKVEYFFDPTLAIDQRSADATKTPAKTPLKVKNNLSNAFEAEVNEVLYSSKHLFYPCTIIKTLDDEKKGGSASGSDASVPVLVKTSDGALHKISDSTKLIQLTSPQDYQGLPDVLHLPHVTEASLLHALRVRYNRDDIYTSAGPILVSVNPYKNVTVKGESLYSEEQMMLYRKTSSSSTPHAEDQLPPHLFKVADKAYSALIASGAPELEPHIEEEDAVLSMSPRPMGGRKIRDQSIIISGESGAGKTEATKVIMKYLARITKKALAGDGETSASADVSSLEDRVLSSNPLLESFGNARTLRNDNSSRFGKFIEISFDTTTGHIIGASISNYLLEKTRITTQIEGERNYHIFYQLLTGADDGLLEDLDLAAGVAAFRYLGNRSAQKSRRDATGFEVTMECLSQIGLKDDDRKVILRFVAATLHLGNIEFEEEGDPEGEGSGESENAKITDASLPSLTKACALLGLNEDEVKEAMLTKLLTVGGKTIHKPQNVAQAQDKRDALAKMAYSSLFLWLVGRINETIAPSLDGRGRGDSVDGFSPGLRVSSKAKLNAGFIGVLDIYGFEQFDTNGFEQLLINYANEKLQRHFNRHLFEVEQELYESEGVDWSYITFNDNRPCLELIEGGDGNVGLLSILDDAWGGMGSASEKDVKFVSHLHQQFGGLASPKGKKKGNGSSQCSGKHKNYITPKFGNDRQFIIVHYAGEVRYTANEFVEKNVESLSNELKDLGSQSSIKLAKDIFACSTGGDSSTSADLATTPARRSTIRGVSVASQFKTSLQTLVADLEQTQPHYIRCIKPNLEKASALFDSGEVLRQLRYAGMMETIRIRREGYALREDHASFYNRFHLLLNPEETAAGEGISHLVQVLSKRLDITDADWQIGHTKIFLRLELATKLELLALLRVHAAARTIGRFGRFVAERQASKLLTAWGRLRLHMLKIYRERNAATSIQSAYRMTKERELYKAMQIAAVKVQSFQRRNRAIAIADALRDPYSGMTFAELKALYTEESARLDEAAEKNDFQTAAELEAKIAPLKEAMEAKRPLTRTLLESMIEETQVKLDDALARKAYDECAPLQKKVNGLIKKRDDLPTISELKQAVRKAEKAVADAAARRNFSAAASGQGAIDAAKKRLQDALDAEGLTLEDVADVGEDAVEDDGEAEVEAETSPYLSRADLETDISALQKSVEEAIASKRFKEASALQKDLDGLESLREKYPTVTEMEVKLTSMKSEMESAIKSKNFAKAEEIQGDIDVLEEKIKVEKERNTEAGQTDTSSSADRPGAFVVDGEGEKIEFTSRSELEKKIREVSIDLSNIIAAKDFKKATATQQLVDKLEALRPLLPTVSEMKKALADKKREMQAAISGKDFGKAGELQETIDALEKEVKEEVDKEKENAKPVGALPRLKGTTPRVMRLTSNNTVQSAPVLGKKLMKMPSSVAAKKDSKAVSKLRPKKPILIDVNDSVLSVCQTLANKRSDAAIIPGINGGVSGIITDTDVTRRVVAKHLDPSITGVSEVMTANPTCVSMQSAAMDALGTMVENHFRHLPVVDDSGAVVGLLDIAKCLNDAISKLEKAQDKSSSAAEDAVKQVASLQGAGGAQAEMLTQLLGGLVSQAFGGKTSPTLRSLLAGKPATVVSPGTNLRDAGMMMAEARKAALVVDEGELVGIFGFKDMMTRAIAKEMPLELTAVSSVMTPNPESVSPDTTVLEALQIMHDNKFLTLPVCEEDGTVVGLVGVMDLVYGSGGADGWRSIFDSAMDLADDGSEVSSMNSYGTSLSTTRQVPKSNKSTLSSVKEGNDKRPVSKLRPKKPMIAAVDDSVLSVTQMLANKRGDAALVTGVNGGLAGIITDTDVTRRVVAKHLDPSITGVSEVMTANPTCVSMQSAAMDALGTMVENHFRHLPVVDDSGAVVGLLDIAKCLNDAISKLEKAQDKSSSAAEDAVKQVASLQGAGGAQAEMLTQLLGGLVSQAFGGKTSPTLRSLLAGKPATVVSPGTNLRDAGMMMAEARKAALVVDEGELVGIFGFKDMMTRAIAKEMPLELTAVSSVMTPNPESVSPDTTVLEALQIMHDNKFLTLPVCEEDGTVVGLVGVMDLVYGSGGADGWRSIFDSAMDLADDGSDSASLVSARSATRSAKSARSSGKGSSSKKDERPVSKLRPKKPMIAAVDDSVLSVTQMLANKRGDAALVTGVNGGLAGIITDTDVTRRVVAKHLDPSITGVSEVMTANPTCVSMQSAAMDALGTMVENHFRHLPVVDDSGAVVGLLDIAKCLNDAISKLEKAQDKSSSAAEDAVKQMASLQGAGGAQAEMLTQLLGGLVSQAFGGKTSPTLRSLLAGKPATVVSPGTNLRDAGMMMAEARKAALVVDEGELVGIFGFKDMMTRAIAKEMPLELTAVSSVMTPNPESVSPDTTVLEALQIMHDNKFLTLPVCEEDGTVVGLVGVMDLVYGSGGADGWRSIFDSAMDLADDGSDSASLVSARSATRSAKSARSSGKGSSSKKDERPVSKLRPKKPMIAAVDDSVLSVTQMLANKRGDAALVTGVNGGLAGIITDTDVTRRVVAKHLDPSITGVSEVMTANPTCVSMQSAAMDALGTMVENHFRHLPVVDDSGAVVGLLDIAKCLNDAISKLEKAQDKSSSAAEDAVKQVASLQGAGGAQAEMLTQLLGGLVSQAFGGKTSPTLRSLLAGKPATVVSPGTNLRDAGMMMAEARKAALVVDEGELVGIFGFKDMMTRAIAKEMPLELTAVSSVMTPNPESVSPDTTVLEALQIMHDNKFLTLPVCEEDGTVIGLVGVMDLVYGSGGADGWRSIFDSAMDIADDGSDRQSAASFGSQSLSKKGRDPVLRVAADTPFGGRSHKNIPIQVEVHDMHSERGSICESTIQEMNGLPSRNLNDTMSLLENPSVMSIDQSHTVFKIVDSIGNKYRVRCENKFDKLIGKLSESLGSDIDSSSLSLTFIDDEGDAVNINSDDCLLEAIENSRRAGHPAVKLALVLDKTKAGAAIPDKTLLMAGAGALAALAVGLAIVLKPRS